MYVLSNLGSSCGGLPPIELILFLKYVVPKSYMYDLIEPLVSE